MINYWEYLVLNIVINVITAYWEYMNIYIYIYIFSVNIVIKLFSKLKKINIVINYFITTYWEYLFIFC